MPLNIRDYNELYMRAQFVEQELDKKKTEEGYQARTDSQDAQDAIRHDKRPSSWKKSSSTSNKKRNFRGYGKGGRNQTTG